MTKLPGKVNPVLFASIGQSQWAVPIGGDTVVDLIRAAGYATFDAAIAGIAWAQWVRWYQWAIISQATSAPTTILGCMGGTTDIDLGVDGDVAYANMQTIAAAAETAGYTYVIAATLTGGFDSAPKLAERDAFNTTVRANSGGTFDAIVDLEANVDLADYTDPIFYQDDTHWTQPGADIAAALWVAGIESLL